MKKTGKAYYMISAVAQKYNIHPQTLRLYEREGLLKPSRTDGNTRLYSEEDLEQLETILTLTRDLGVNLAGVEVILNMRRKIQQMQGEVNEFMEYVKRELARGIDDWEQRLSTAMALLEAHLDLLLGEGRDGSGGGQYVHSNSGVIVSWPGKFKGSFRSVRPDSTRKIRPREPLRH
jgi:MerR family transcriptional regulator/heat shock protein HspR